MRLPLLLPGAHWRDRLVACLGALLCLAATAALCRALPFGPADLPFLVAPLGASAVLVFAVPASPLAQPWPVIGGNTLSALAGALIVQAVPDPAIAAGAAVAGAILVMSLFRCLHPPGGAAALTAVIGGPAIRAAGFGFALWPVAANSVVLVLLGIVFHRLTRRTYPHVAPPAPRPGFAAADIDAALEEMHESFDISRADLDALLARAEAHARGAGR